MYRTIMIKKRSGGYRKLEEPDPVLKYIQRQLAKRLKMLVTDRVPFPSFVTGSFGSLAGTHNTGKPHVANMVIVGFDIENFFGTVTTDMAYEALRFFIGLPDVEARALAYMVTYENHLPQGAPTSPIMANLAAMRMHHAVKSFAESYGAAYTVYVDDMYISSEQGNRFADEVLLVKQGIKAAGLKIRAMGLKDIVDFADSHKLPNPFKVMQHTVQQYGFKLKDEKLRIMPKGGKQQIMDVSVSRVNEWQDDQQRTRMSKEKRKQMLCAIHNLANLNPKSSLSHIRGLLCQAKRLNDQQYLRAKIKFDDAVTRWKHHLTESPVVLKWRNSVRWPHPVEIDRRMRRIGRRHALQGNNNGGVQRG